MEILQVTYDFLGLCDPWAAHIILGSAFEILTATKVDGSLRRAGRQPPPACYIKPPTLEYWIEEERNYDLFRVELAWWVTWMKS
jgi:hypothetical protein